MQRREEETFSLYSYMDRFKSGSSELFIRFMPRLMQSAEIGRKCSPSVRTSTPSVSVL